MKGSRFHIGNIHCKLAFRPNRVILGFLVKQSHVCCIKCTSTAVSDLLITIAGCVSHDGSRIKKGLPCLSFAGLSTSLILSQRIISLSAEAVLGRC